MMNNKLKRVLMEGTDDTLISCGCIDYENREILIDGDIDEDTIVKYAMPIISMNKDDDDMEVPIETRRPITIYINCNGGDIHNGFALIDIIKASKTPIIGVAMRAFSMGVLIYLACHTRYCYNHTPFLIHDGSIFLSNSLEKVKDTYRFYAGTQDEFVKSFILENTKISKSLLSRKSKTEWFITAHESVKLGMTDEVLNSII